MKTIIAIWGFGLLIYFKVAFDIFYRADITIFAAFLCTIAATTTIFIASGLYSLRTLKWNWTPGAQKGTVGELLKRTLPLFLFSSIICALIIRLIIFGFSKRLDRDIDLMGGYGSRRRISEEFAIFMVVVIAPLLIHYLISIAHVVSNMKKDEDDSVP